MGTVARDDGLRATAGSLFADVPDRLAAERFDQVLRLATVRIERIVSTGQATPVGEWFDQAWDEWVLVVAGAAEILLETEDAPRSMTAGDYLFIPAHLRHRVTFTDLNQPTVWLAIHIDGPVPKA
jgi:cupin 2 domain-containing protein